MKCQPTKEPKETPAQMAERVRRDPNRNHCPGHGVILLWIDGRCARCVHRERHGNVSGVEECDGVRRMAGEDAGKR